MLVTNNDSVIRQIAYKVNGQLKKVNIGPLQTINLHDLTSESQVFRNLFGLKVRKANTSLSRNLVEDVDLDGPSPNYGPATIFSFPQQSWPSTATTVSGWNTLFNLPTNGSPFTTLNVDGDGLYLTGGSAINLNATTFPANMIGINDNLSAITSIGSTLNMRDVKSVSLPGLTTIPNNAFKGQSSLINIELGGVTTIGSTAFSGINTTTPTVFSSLTDASTSAFTSSNLFGSTLTSSAFPNLISIGEACFSNNTSLKSVNIVGPTTMEDYTFLNCSALTSVTITNTEDFGYNSVGGIGYNFLNCNSLTTVDLPDVLYLGTKIFSQCSGLTSLNIPKAVVVGDIFDINLSMFTPTLNDSLLNVGYGRALTNTFSGYTNLRSVNLSSVTTSTGSFARCTFLTSVTLNNVISINSDFDNCVRLTNVSLPSLTSIGTTSFRNCTGLTFLNFPSLNGFVAGAVFSGCTSLIGIGNIGATTFTSSNNAFEDCWSLTGVTASATTVQSRIFYNCSALTNVGLYRATNIGTSAFTNCVSLASITLPSATTVSNHAFKNCRNLTYINLSACTSIGSSVADNGVFLGITGKVITLVVPSSRMTANAGSPDGDIQYLQANNTVTIVTV